MNNHEQLLKKHLKPYLNPGGTENAAGTRVQGSMSVPIDTDDKGQPGATANTVSSMLDKRRPLLKGSKPEKTSAKKSGSNSQKNKEPKEETEAGATTISTKSLYLWILFAGNEAEENRWKGHPTAAWFLKVSTT